MVSVIGHRLRHLTDDWLIDVEVIVSWSIKIDVCAFVNNANAYLRYAHDYSPKYFSFQLIILDKDRHPEH